MPIRYIGAVLVFLSSGAFGFVLAANCRKEERCLSELVRLLENMQSELEYRLTPLPQICSHLADDASGVLKKVFSKLSRELEDQIAPDATTCMQAAVTAVRELPTAAKDMLLQLGNSLGRYDLDGQLREIAAIKQQCDTKLAHMRDNQDVRLRSYQTLGLCAGAGLAILFL